MTNPNIPTLAQARAAWKTRLRQAYSDTSAGIVSVVVVLGSLLALAASGDLTDASMLAASAGWMLVMPLVIAAPAFFAAGPYPSAKHHADVQMLAAVMVAVREQHDAAARGNGADLDECD